MLLISHLIFSNLNTRYRYQYCISNRNIVPVSGGDVSYKRKASEPKRLQYFYNIPKHPNMDKPFAHHNLPAFSFLLRLWQQSHICAYVCVCAIGGGRRAVTVRSDTRWLGLQDAPLSRLSHLRQERLCELVCVCVCLWSVTTGCTSCSLVRRSCTPPPGRRASCERSRRHGNHGERCCCYTSQ